VRLKSAAAGHTRNMTRSGDGGHGKGSQAVNSVQFKKRG
jgi:hypothetical protein